MRIAPLGLAFRHAPMPVLYEAVKAALLATHTHPDGIAGALVQAAAVAWLQGQVLQPQEQQQQGFAGNHHADAAAACPGLSNVLSSAGLSGPCALLAHLRRTCGGYSAQMDSKLQLLHQTVASGNGYSSRQLAPEAIGKHGRWAEYFSSKAWADELALSQTLAPDFQMKAVEAEAAALCALV